MVYLHFPCWNGHVGHVGRKPQFQVYCWWYHVTYYICIYIYIYTYNHIYNYIYTMWGPRSISKLVNITPMSRTGLCYANNELVAGANLLTNVHITGGLTLYETIWNRPIFHHHHRSTFQGFPRAFRALSARFTCYDYVLHLEKKIWRWVNYDNLPVYVYILVGGFKHDFYDFPIILGMECHHPNWLSLHNFQRGRLKPPTR